MRGEQELFLAEFLGDHARDLWLNLCAWSLNSLSAARREGMSQIAYLWAQKRASSENKAAPQSKRARRSCAGDTLSAGDTFERHYEVSLCGHKKDRGPL
jgi:hypothetical protein